MKVLHTSDWHLGRQLYQRSRYREFSAFLDWLVNLLQQECIDVLLIAGDVFDNTTPSYQAQSLYYQFLHQVAAGCCRHVVIIAGNHDSSSLLEAPKALLGTLNVHVVGSVRAIEDEVLVLDNANAQPALIVCAVPYLRDRDVRYSMAGESSVDKANQLIKGIQAHYQAVGEYAKTIQQGIIDNNGGQAIPIIGMGHLFAAGGRTLVDDGVRDLYVGSLAHLDTGTFPACFDYVALGHLHVAQSVAKQDHIRYCGSPIAMGFGEARQQKVLLSISFANAKPHIDTIKIPCWQALQRVTGDWQQLEANLQKLLDLSASLWLEVIYQGDESIADIRQRLDSLIAGSELDILSIRNDRTALCADLSVVTEDGVDAVLDSLSQSQVFQQCLRLSAVPKKRYAELSAVHNEILQGLHQSDVFGD